MSRTIKLTGIEIDFDEIKGFTELEYFPNIDLYAATITTDKVNLSIHSKAEYDSFFSQYHAIKYGKNGQNENG